MKTDSSSGLSRLRALARKSETETFSRPGQPLHFDFLVRRFRLIQGRFVVVVQQRLVVGARPGRHGCRQQPFGQHHVGAQTRSVGGVTAFANALEADAGGDHPHIGRGTLEIGAEILEDRRMLRRRRDEVVDGLVDARRQAGVGHVVTQNAPVHHLGEERAPGQQLAKQMRNVLAAVGHEGLVIPRPAAKRHDDGLAVPGLIGALQSRSIDRRAQRRTGHAAKELTAADGNRRRQFPQGSVHAA